MTSTISSFWSYSKMYILDYHILETIGNRFEMEVKPKHTSFKCKNHLSSRRLAVSNDQQRFHSRFSVFVFGVASRDFVGCLHRALGCCFILCKREY